MKIEMLDNENRTPDHIRKKLNNKKEKKCNKDALKDIHISPTVQP